MPADVADEKEELPEQLSDQQNEHDSLDDDPTWSPEELERAYKAMKMMTVQEQMKILGSATCANQCSQNGFCCGTDKLSGKIMLLKYLRHL